MQFTIIANPENRRCQYFVEAVHAAGLPPVQVVSYVDVLNNQVDWDTILTNTDSLRIESFGENFEVWRKLVLRGNRIEPDLSQQITAEHEIKSLVFEQGRIQYSKQLYQGYQHWLQDLQQKLDAYPAVQVMNSPKSIALMFDKMACHQHFSNHQISVVPALPRVVNYTDLRQQMTAKGWNRVFVKLNYGSSASGVLALRVNGDKIQATTSVELIKTLHGVKLYNSLQVKQYTNESDIALIIDILAQEDLIVEKWIPKATSEDGIFDLRIVVIDGKPDYTVVRQSQLPMTNLHLGNKRGTAKAIQELIGIEKWQSLHDLATQAVQTLPNTLYAGVDVLLSSNYKQQYVLETNAFGDLLPHVLRDDLDTYQATVKAAIARWKANQ